MQFLSSIVLTLATAATLVMADPASVPEIMGTSVSFDAQATVAGTMIYQRRGATVARYAPAPTVGTASSATCTGVVLETVRPRGGILGATVAAAATVASPF